jgi:hypothetical protein
MKKANPGGGFERGWFGPMIIIASQQQGVQWEYQLRFHTNAEDALYQGGAWIPKNDLSAASKAPSQEP